MECNGKNRLISLYVDNMLSQEMKASLEKHMDTCIPCRETLKAYTVMKDMIRHVYRDDPVDVRPKVIHSITRSRRYAKGTLVAAAMIGLIFCGYFWGSYQSFPTAKPMIANQTELKNNSVTEVTAQQIDNVKVRYENVSF